MTRHTHTHTHTRTYLHVNRICCFVFFKSLREYLRQPHYSSVSNLCSTLTTQYVIHPSLTCYSHVICECWAVLVLVLFWLCCVCCWLCLCPELWAVIQRVACLEIVSRDLCDSAWGDTVRWRDAQLQEVTNLFLVFQTIEMRPPHYVGAGMAFGLGLVYCWLQTSISLRHPPIDYVTVAQLINSVVLSVCLVTCILSWV